MQDLTITIIQSELAWEDIDANLENFGSKIKNIDQYHDLIILPEMFNSGFSVHPENFAELIDGKTMQWLKKQSRENNCTIVGSLVIKENGNYFNRLVWMQPDGRYHTYNKRHLFRMGEEHIVFSEGNNKIVIELKGWKIMPLICYDLRFPIWSKNTYNNDTFEYDILIYVANWPEIRSYLWKTLLKARAIENISYVVGLNRVGKDGNLIDHSGDSAIIDFQGELIEECPPFEESIITCTLNYDKLQKFRKDFNAGLDWDDFEINV